VQRGGLREVGLDVSGCVRKCLRLCTSSSSHPAPEEAPRLQESFSLSPHSTLSCLGSWTPVRLPDTGSPGQVTKTPQAARMSDSGGGPCTMPPLSPLLLPLTSLAAASRS
jgi:hypothetical protein